MGEDIKKLIIDYVKKEYLDEDSDQEITEDTADLKRHCRFVFHGFVEDVP
jgi:hypothetical protein